MLRTLHPALHIKQNEPPPEMLPTRERWIVGVLAAVAGVAMVMGVVGACVRVSRGGTGTASRATPYLWHSGLWHRYLSHLGRASLWVYVTHLPWVGLAAVVMFGLRVPGDVKALAAFVFALTMSMLTCRLFTGTRVGRWLGA
jgi:hypothetical protein